MELLFKRFKSCRPTWVEMGLIEALEVYEFKNKVRGGIERDGGYVYGELDGGYDCYISAGVSGEESFTQHFLEKYGLNEFQAYAFDGTIDAYPYQYTKSISYIKKNIDSYNDADHTNLAGLFQRFERMFLKMDIEGGEYPWLSSLSEEDLKKCKQIVIEVHSITNSHGFPFEEKSKCLEKLAKTHYLIHAHGNNNGRILQILPDVLELTYIQKKYFTEPPLPNTQPMPIPGLDFANNPDKHDYQLHFYPFLAPNR